MPILNLEYVEFSWLRDLVKREKHSFWLKMVKKRDVKKDVYDKFWEAMEKDPYPIGEDQIIGRICKKMREAENELQKLLKE